MFQKMTLAWQAVRVHSPVNELTEDDLEVVLSPHKLCAPRLNVAEVNVEDVGEVNHVDAACNRDRRHPTSAAASSPAH